jgi:hypothetical protein
MARTIADVYQGDTMKTAVPDFPRTNTQDAVVCNFVRLEPTYSRREGRAAARYRFDLADGVGDLLQQTGPVWYRDKVGVDVCQTFERRARCFSDGPGGE